MKQIKLGIFMGGIAVGIIFQLVFNVYIYRPKGIDPRAKLEDYRLRYQVCFLYDPHNGDWGWVHEECPLAKREYLELFKQIYGEVPTN